MDQRAESQFIQQTYCTDVYCSIPALCCITEHIDMVLLAIQQNVMCVHTNTSISFKCIPYMFETLSLSNT